MSEAYFNPKSRVFDTLSSLGEESSHPNGRNFVLIFLQNSPSYHQLASSNTTQKNSTIQQSTNNLLGFYQQNNFTYYPYAYVKHNNNPYLNVVSSLNLETAKDPEQLLLSDVIMNGYWDFKNLGHSKLYMKDNHIFDKFTKEDYNIRVYEGEGIELCSINSRLSVNRCIKRTGLPISFDDLEISSLQKTAILLAEWLESTGLIKGIDPILGLTSAFTREVSPLRFSTKQLKTYNAFKNLDLITQDISTDKGNNFYVTILDIPGHLFMYDNLCKLKPISQWISAQDSSISLAKRKEAFAEQTSCLYGQLEKFMQQLERSDKLAHTTIIIAGLNTPFPSIPGTEKNLFKNLQNTKQVGIAVYDPLKNQADMDYSLCTTSGIMEKHLDKQTCEELDGFTVTDQLKAQLFQDAKKQELSNKQIEEAKNAFKQWYSSWAAYHQVKNNMAEEIIPLEKSPDTPEIIPEKEIKEAPKATPAEELAPETEVKTLNEVAKETIVKEDKEPTATLETQKELSQEKTVEEEPTPVQKNETENKTAKKEESSQPQTIENKKAEETPATFKEVKEEEQKTNSTNVQKQEKNTQTPKEEAKASVPKKKAAPAQVKTTKKTEPQKQSVSETKPLPKPEKLKQEFKKKQAAAQESSTSVKKEGQAQISVEVKVIERSTGNDVIPPALIDDLKDAPQPQE